MRRQIYCVSVFVLLTMLLSFSTVWAGSKDENNGYKMFEKDGGDGGSVL